MEAAQPHRPRDEGRPPSRGCQLSSGRIQKPDINNYTINSKPTRKNHQPSNMFSAPSHGRVIPERIRNIA